MNHTVFIALVNNAALLLALAVVYEISYVFPVRSSALRQLISGLLISIICIFIMKFPFELQPGLMIDARSILISTSALIFGPVPTAVAVISAIVFRLYSGGIGAMTGIIIIITSALIGSAWRFLVFPRTNKWNWLNVYIMSLAVHAAMLVCMLMLPYPESVSVLRDIALPVLLTYPIVSILLSLLLLRQQDIRAYQLQLKQSEEKFQKINEEALVDSELKYHRLFESMKYGIMIIEADTGIITDINPYLLMLSGYSEDFFLGRQVWNLGIFHEITAGREEIIRLQDGQHLIFDDAGLFTLDGEHKNIELVISAYYVKDQKMLQVNVRDTTDSRTESSSSMTEARKSIFT